MIITDAIIAAPTEHAVYFLVTSYIESFRRFGHAPDIPGPVLHLPLAGAADLRERLRALRNDINAPLDTVVSASELGAVLDTALTRLAGESVGAEDRGRGC